jgi:hypothetical protein
MIANALQLQQKRTSAVEDRVPRLLQTSDMVRFEGTPQPELTGECIWNEGERTRSRAFVFPLAMVAISIAREVGTLLIGNALLAWFGTTFDRFILSVVLQLVVMLIGIGMVSRFSKASPDSAARRHMVLILLAAMAIGLILAWLSRLVGDSNALTWPLVLVYLLWAWAAAVSAG